MHPPTINDAPKLQSVLNAAATSLGASQSSPISLLSSETSFTGFLFISTSNSWSALLWETFLLAWLNNTSRPTVSQFLLYLVVLPFGIRHRAAWLSLGHKCLWLNLEVLLLWAHRTGTSYLSPSKIFSNIFWSVPQAHENLTILSVKTLALVGSTSDLGGTL